ncbi:glycosyltransferase [Microbacterium sp. DT81.1]|uniref:glycosyltransferase n=1 Tax=Microbacterium sp. DT81.1 TaxID=3393413 RepID=UPI003CFA6218
MPPTPRTILVVHPGAELYGSDRVLLDSVLGLVDSGFSVRVMLPEEGPLADELRTAGASVFTSDLFVLRKRLLRPSGWMELASTAFRGMRATLRTLRSTRPDMVFVNTITLPMWPMLARAKGVPVLLHIHEGESGARSLVKRVLYLPALFAHRILINSQFSLDVMTSVYPRLSSRTEIVPNSVPAALAPPPARPDLVGGLRVLYVGRLSPRKGVDLVVDAVGKLREAGEQVSLDIVGSAFSGYEWFEERLRAAAQDVAPDHVRFHGFQPEIWSFLSHSDVLVVPSRFDEPFGNTAVEGILAGRPVVVSETSGLIEATRGISTAYRITPGDAAAIARALREIAAAWPEVIVRLDDSRSLAQERHAPSVYRERIAEAARDVVRRRS